MVVATLQEQAGGIAPLNPIEMHSKIPDEIISKLDKDPVLKKISGGYPQGFTGENITDDAYSKNVDNADSAFAINGYVEYLVTRPRNRNIGYHSFKENKCATCHGGII